MAWETCPATITDTAPDGATFALRCADLAVPISYREPQRGHLTLHLAEARSAGVAADAPALVVLPDDPGATGIATIAAIAATLPAEVRRRYAIVTLDQRGTGSSSGIDCVSGQTAAAIYGMGADPATASGGAQLAAIGRQLTFDCGDMVGPALTTINSTNAANDLDTVRSALRARTLSLLAAGGSATIGAVYANRYPGRVGAIVLDSPADPLSGPIQHATASAAAAERLFDDFAVACAGFTGGCALGPKPRERVESLTARLATSGTRTGRWVMTGGSIVLALTELLPDQGSWPALARAIAALGDDDAGPLAALLTKAGGGADLTARLSARVLFTCNDSATRLSRAEIGRAATAARTAAPLFGPFAVATASLCAQWPAPDEPLGRLSGAGAAPILVIGSVRSATRPFAEARSVAGQLASAVLVSWQSGSTGAYLGSRCVQSAVDAYLLSGAAPDRGTLCPP
jgi:pimeloyl-ACP methyl ester carboxylesterase